ncbi:hypothetical protein VNO77_45345 [Canavalia gladiata]|uniref:Uncharacterized protein n=1 Tax=Canavalia gladiata TaxID=3824 RepID=A0AAN9JK75_CANGL
MVFMRFIQVLPLMLEDWPVGLELTGFGVISPNNVPWLVWHLQRGCSRVLESLVPFDILNASRCIVSSCWWFHPWSHDGIRVPRKLPAHTRWLLRWGGQATTLFVFSVPNKYLNYGYLVMPSEADMAPFDVSICLHAFAIAGCGSLHGVGSSRREGLLADDGGFDTMHAFHFRFAFVHSYCDNACTMSLVIDGCYLVDPASSHMLVSKIKPCMCNNSRANTCNKPRLLEGMHLLDKRSTQALPVALMIHDNSSDRTALVPAMHHSNFCPINFRCKKLVVGPWVGSIGSASGVHIGCLVPSARRCAPGLNWPGRASCAVTLKKLECSKQAYALDTLAWDNTTGF